MTLLWTIPALLAATDAVLQGEVTHPISGISIDTRTLNSGDLFVALEGARDGHDFVAAAFEKGAAAALVQADRMTELSAHGPLLGVKQVLTALERLGQAARSRTQASVLAVTGSVGKTGTKEALKAILSQQGCCHAAEASCNNHLGVPLTLARMPQGTEFGIFEIGMNHAFEILPLTRMVRPHVALITTIESVHIEHFRSLAGIADAKGEIFVGLEEGGIALLNRDNPWFERLKVQALASKAGRIVTFGLHQEADWRAVSVTGDAQGSDVRVHAPIGAFPFRLGMPGEHLVPNMLGLLAGVAALGGDVHQAAHALAHLHAPPGRGARIRLTLPQGGEALLIDESYNANPTSMRAAIATLAATPAKRRIAVLGDMLELGTMSEAAHKSLAQELVAAKIDQVYCAGPLMRLCFEALPKTMQAGYAVKAEDILPLVQKGIQDDDALMSKGSNGSHVFRIVAGMRQTFG
jgi:UDP-N-acetylmuramoyl-tripeptide--D-alanyl-D-alanine ligase